MYLKQWELENQQDNEPSAATQAMLKSFLDRIDSAEKSKSDEQIDNTSRTDFVQEEPALTDSGDEMPVEAEIP
jgi:hypothetical protein